jgi:hypothetical protein
MNVEPLKLSVMKNNYYYSDKDHQIDDEVSGLLLHKVKWTEDGILQPGTVTEIYSEKEIKYLMVMTIFGKRCKVKISKLRLISENMRA